MTDTEKELNAWRELGEEMGRVISLMDAETFADWFPDWFGPRLFNLQVSASALPASASPGSPDRVIDCECPTCSTSVEKLSEADERRLLDVAFGFHVSIEGEYGCPGATCPGVQRLVERMRALKGVGRYDYLSALPASEGQEPPAQKDVK